MIQKILSALLYPVLLLSLASCGVPANRPAGEIAETAQPAALSISYADDALLSQPDACERFSVTESEWTVNAAISTDVPVTDLKVLSIAMEAVGDDGVMSFRVSQELYALDELSPEKPLVLGVEFAGMVPDIGISYRDADGTEQFYALTMSGESGDLLLMDADIMEVTP